MIKENNPRRKDRRMPLAESIAFLRRTPYVFMSTTSPDGTPYCVPISIYMGECDDVVYFHCGRSGKKIDNIKNNPAVCISCAEYDGTLSTSEGGYIVSYRSVVAFGTVEEVADVQEKRMMLAGFCGRQIDPEIEAYGNYMKCVKRAFVSTPVYRINITSISGKQNPGSGSAEEVKSH